MLKKRRVRNSYTTQPSLVWLTYVWYVCKMLLPEICIQQHAQLDTRHLNDLHAIVRCHAIWYSNFLQFHEISVLSCFLLVTSYFSGCEKFDHIAGFIQFFKSIHVKPPYTIHICMYVCRYIFIHESLSFRKIASYMAIRWNVLTISSHQRWQPNYSGS